MIVSTYRQSKHQKWRRIHWKRPKFGVIRPKFRRFDRSSSVTVGHCVHVKLSIQCFSSYRSCLDEEKNYFILRKLPECIFGVRWARNFLCCVLPIYNRSDIAFPKIPPVNWETFEHWMVYIKTVSFQPIMKIIFYFFMSLNAKSVEYLFSCIKKKIVK